ncbi:hypothetical protein AA0488_1294 [Kozakia baliensis NRIC 0488]|nr:hypothetical protein AA0488_1294 [Kozakia baliensis NRIC 0488]
MSDQTTKKTIDGFQLALAADCGTLAVEGHERGLRAFFQSEKYERKNHQPD